MASLFGVDVWLNNPATAHSNLRHQRSEIVLNGGLNLSVLDGWWAEAYEV